MILNQIDLPYSGIMYDTILLDCVQYKIFGLFIKWLLWEHIQNSFMCNILLLDHMQHIMVGSFTIYCWWIICNILLVSHMQHIIVWSYTTYYCVIISDDLLFPAKFRLEFVGFPNDSTKSSRAIHTSRNNNPWSLSNDVSSGNKWYWVTTAFVASRSWYIFLVSWCALVFMMPLKRGKHPMN